MGGSTTGRMESLTSIFPRRLAAATGAWRCAPIGAWVIRGLASALDISAGAFGEWTALRVVNLACYLVTYLSFLVFLSSSTRYAAGRWPRGGGRGQAFCLCHRHSFFSAVRNWQRVCLARKPGSPGERRVLFGQCVRPPFRGATHGAGGARAGLGPGGWLCGEGDFSASLSRFFHPDCIFFCAAQTIAGRR